MDHRDQELLDKQLRAISPSPRRDGVMMLALVAVFFAGITLGDFLFAHKSEPMKITSSEATPTMFLANVMPPAARR